MLIDCSTVTNLEIIRNACRFFHVDQMFHLSVNIVLSSLLGSTSEKESLFGVMNRTKLVDIFTQALFRMGYHEA
jgi:hypothetical protein